MVLIMMPVETTTSTTVMLRVMITMTTIIMITMTTMMMMMMITMTTMMMVVMIAVTTMMAMTHMGRLDWFMSDINRNVPTT